MSVKEQEPTQIKESGRSLRLKKKWQDPAWRAERIRAMTGHPVSQDTREKISRANKDRCRTPEYREKMSLERGGVLVKAYPLLLRGGIVEEVAKTTGLQKKQIENLKSHLRKRGGLKRPTKEEERQAKRKSHLSKPSRSHERVYTSRQEKASLLARKFLEAELFTEDLTAWNELHRLYVKNKRLPPEDFADQLRLEVFLRARGSRELLISYRDFGDEVDPVWFDLSLRGEEDFIASNTALGFREDKKGYFRLVGDQVSRPVDIKDGRVVVFDGEELAKREEFRSS